MVYRPLTPNPTCPEFMMHAADIVFVVPNAPQAVIVSNSSQSLGVAQLASSCQHAQYQTKIIDAYLGQLSPDQTAEEIRQYIPRIALAFYIPTESTLEHALRTLNRLAEILPRVQVVFGGGFATLGARKIVASFPYIDLIIRGEADEALLDWLKVAHCKDTWHTINNLCYLDKNGECIETPLRPLLEPLDDLPFPDRKATIALLHETGGSLTITASRGCYGSCSFCQIQSFWALAPGPGWRGYSAHRVVAEIDHVVANFGCKHVDFMDDSFFGPGKKGGQRVEQIADLLAEKDYNISFTITCRADAVCTHQTALKKLQQVGLKKVFMGFDGTAPQTFDTFNKGGTPTSFHEAVKVLTGLGIEMFLGTILFHAESEINEVLENLLFWQDLFGQYPRIKCVIFGSVDPLLGTPLEQRLKEKKLLEGEVLAGQRIRFVQERVACLAGAWEQFKHDCFYPYYFAAVEKDKTAADLLFSRLQVSILLNAAQAGQQQCMSKDELIKKMKECPDYVEMTTQFSPAQLQNISPRRCM